jgi:hypothetical protein
MPDTPPKTKPTQIKDWKTPLLTGVLTSMLTTLICYFIGVFNAKISDSQIHAVAGELVNDKN